MRKRLTFILAFFPIALLFAQEIPDNYLRGRAMLLKQDYDSALHYFDLALHRNPGDYDALYYRAMTHYELKDYPAARDEFHTVNRRYNGRASFMLAKTEVKLGHEAIAIKHLRDHLESSYRLPEKDILLDEDLSTLENSDGWRALWNEKDWYRPFEKELQQVQYLKNNGGELEALNLLKQLAKKGIYKSLVHQYSAEIYRATGNQKAAMEEAERAVGADSRNTEALGLRISLAMENEDYAQAYEDCRRLLRQDPAAFNFYLVSGKAAGKLGKYESALEDFDLYLALFPADHDAMYQKSVMQKESGKYLDALRSVNRALDMDTGHAPYFSTRGEIYATTGMHAYAVKDFSMALDLDPADPETWYMKGLSDLELGNREVACFDFRNAAKLGKFEARRYVEQLCRDPQ